MRGRSRLKALTDWGLAGAPTMTSVASSLSIAISALRSWSAETVSRIMSKLPACLPIASASFVITTSSAPSRFPSAILLSDVVNRTVCAPKAWANFTPMCPSPPSPTMPTFFPWVAPHLRSGEYVVIPAHSSGAACAGSRFAGTLSVNASSQTMLSEYPPKVMPPECLSGPL